MTYPKRLIEVDLPIRRISAHARREKSIRHGHISTLHIWWARRPLAACRAVLCAALWPDPADPNCPLKFREDALKIIADFASKITSDKQLKEHCSKEAWEKWQAFVKKGAELDPKKVAHCNILRFALLDFIADFANWDNSAVATYLDAARSLTQSAHESLGGEPGTRPLVVGPFAGGGSIPLEALRVGADAFASDLNPIAVLLNKVVIEYIPKYGQRLAGALREWARWIKDCAEKELSQFYPRDTGDEIPIAYLWARVVRCEGPGCGAELPLIRTLWLAKRRDHSVALQLAPDPREKRVGFRIIVRESDGWRDQADRNAKIKNPTFDGTVKQGSATCPCCGYTTPVAKVREQLKARHGGANDARLMCVVFTRAGEQGRHYRLPNKSDVRATREARSSLAERKGAEGSAISLVPNEPLDVRGIRHTWAMIYGLNVWEDFFTSRQALALSHISQLIHAVGDNLRSKEGYGFATAVQTCLALVLGRQADALSASVTWTPGGEFQGHTFARQALAFVWDFAEVNPFCDSSGNFMGAVEWVAKVCSSGFCAEAFGNVEQASAANHPLPDDSATAVITDPPYYDAVPYSYLSDFFYVWLRRAVGELHGDMFRGTTVPKDEEIIVDRPHELSNSTHDIAFYERELQKAFAEAWRIVRPDGICTIVFASKTTASWEAILKALVDADWVITGSWPIDTEREARVSAQGQARLASSVHLVCRPRIADGVDDVGEWRDVLQELPRRIHEWMPRLAGEGVVGADAIFACLGPALEIFSRYSRVEKADGTSVALKEYLEHVWAAVSKEAISMIFAGADTTGFEEDARLTAMWLWTLSPGTQNGQAASGNDHQSDEAAEEEESASAPPSGFALEFDAARKIAQGLGVHLENLASLVEVKGETARLLPVAERTRALFGKDGTDAPAAKRKRSAQLTLPGLIEELEQDEKGWTLQNAAKPGDTTLDRVHQSMILFASGRSEALRRFLVDEGVGKNQKFWRLAQALNALYPSGTDERRWVEGVLARKKGLGL